MCYTAHDLLCLFLSWIPFSTIKRLISGSGRLLKMDKYPSLQKTKKKKLFLSQLQWYFSKHN